MAARSRISSMVLSTCASPASMASILDGEIFVIAQLEFRKHFEHSAEAQRLAFFEINFVHFRARYGNKIFFTERLFEIFRHQRLHHFALNIFGEAAANQCDGSFAGTKSRDASHAREIARYFFGGFRYVLGWNFQLEFTFACGFCHSKFFREELKANSSPIYLSPVPNSRSRAGKCGGRSPRVKSQYREDGVARQPDECCGRCDFSSVFKYFCGRRDSNPYGLSATSS